MKPKDLGNSTERRSDHAGFKCTAPATEFDYQPGDVFQINERHGRNGWIGALVLATEIRLWGIQGFVAHVETHDTQAKAFIRLKWDELDFVGHAPLMPADYVDDAKEPA